MYMHKLIQIITQSGNDIPHPTCSSYNVTLFLSSRMERVPCSQPPESQWVCGDFDRIKVSQKWHYVTSEFRSEMVMQTLLGSPLAGSQLPPKSPPTLKISCWRGIYSSSSHEPSWAPSQQPESTASHTTDPSWPANIIEPSQDYSPSWHLTTIRGGPMGELPSWAVPQNHDS